MLAVVRGVLLLLHSYTVLAWMCGRLLTKDSRQEAQVSVSGVHRVLLHPVHTGAGAASTMNMQA
jgi:hypothetical protein